MKYIYLTLLSLMATLCATAQEYAICIAHSNMQDYALTTDIDSIYFDASGTTLYVQPMAGGSPVQFAAADVQAISSLPASDSPSVSWSISTAMRPPSPTPSSSTASAWRRTGPL